MLKLSLTESLTNQEPKPCCKRYALSTFLASWYGLAILFNDKTTTEVIRITTHLTKSIWNVKQCGEVWDKMVLQKCCSFKREGTITNKHLRPHNKLLLKIHKLKKIGELCDWSRIAKGCQGLPNREIGITVKTTHLVSWLVLQYYVS